MKFVETLYGQLVNIEDISMIDHDGNETLDKVYSYLILKNGDKICFLDLPDSFEDKHGKEYKFDGDHLISLHRHAIDVMCRNCYFVLKLDDLMDWAWEKFTEEFQMKIIDAKVG
jgi:hypothetical protein